MAGVKRVARYRLRPVPLILKELKYRFFANHYLFFFKSVKHDVTLMHGRCRRRGGGGGGDDASPRLEILGDISPEINILKKIFWVHTIFLDFPKLRNKVTEIQEEIRI